MKERTGWKSSDPGKRDVDDSRETGVSEHGVSGPTSDPEVAALPQRRTFTAEYKEQILAAVDTLGHGEIGAFLRHRRNPILRPVCIRSLRTGKELRQQRADFFW